MNNIRKTYLILLDILIVIVSFIIIAWFKKTIQAFSLKAYFYPILIFFPLWILISLIWNKYRFNNKKNLSKLYSPVISVDFVILAIILIIFYAFKVHIESRLLVFGTILLSLFFEIIFLTIYYINEKIESEFDYSSSITGPSHLIESEFIATQQERTDERQIDLFQIDNIENSIYLNLKNRYLSKNQRLFNFINHHIPLEKIAKNESLILNTMTTYNFENFEYKSILLFINLHRINDILRINKYFIEVHKILKNDGLFINCVEPKALRKRRILTKFPPVLNYIFYSLDYIFKRVMPKLPFTKQIYFLISKGHNRVISEPETLGRLYSCGFEVVETKYINNFLYFIAKKIKEPIYNNTPTYGPISRLQRIGKDGKLFTVYKMRTMYPYSEYLQAYIYKKNKLQEGGKIKNDYRVTTIGRFMRKVWLDELPMLYNIIKEDLKLVGVRPLSKHFFNLYPEKFQKRRIKYKPGLLPPFYLDLPKTLDEVITSEARYLDEYDKYPIKTDIKYFFKILYNILIKKARSK